LGLLLSHAMTWRQFRRQPWRQLLRQRRRLHDHLRTILPGHASRVCSLLAVWGQGRAAVSWWNGHRRAGGHRLFTAN